MPVRPSTGGSVSPRPLSGRPHREVQANFPKAKVLNDERVRFEVAGGDFRMIVSFDFTRQIAYIEFLGTHAEYDRVDALAVSLY